MTSDQSYPKSNRLRKSPEFKTVYESRNSAADNTLIVFALPNGLERSRLGLSVSRKVGNAVVRNRWKRLIREAFRKHRTEWVGNLDLIVLPQRGAVLPTQRQVEQSLVKIVGRILKKLGRMKNPEGENPGTQSPAREQR